MGNIISKLLEFLAGTMRILPYLCILVLLYIILCLIRRLSSPNPFSRLLGKRSYSVSTWRSFGYSIFIKGGKKYDPKLLHNAICELFYLYPKLYHNPCDAKLYIQDNSEHKHDLSIFAESPFVHLDFSALPMRYDDEFYICYPNAESISIPPYSHRLCFERYENKHLERLTLKCPAPIAAYADSQQRHDIPITVSEKFVVRVPAMQLSIYQASEVWQRLTFRTEDGTPVPLHFEAIP